MKQSADASSSPVSCRYWTKLAVAAASTLIGAQMPAPPLPMNAAKASEFVPNGWTLEQQKVADLNRDGRDDALLLMRRSQESGTPQRILALVLRQRGSNAAYALSEVNDRLIPHGDDAKQEDPMTDGELRVRRGGFDVKLTLFAGVGSYQTATLLYRFSYQDGCFRLIGYDRMETHRGTLDTRDLSIDYLNGAVVHRTGNAQSNASKKDRAKLRRNPRRCFGEMESASAFKPL